MSTTHQQVEQERVYPVRPGKSLAPVAYNDLVVPSLRLSQSSHLARRVANAIVVMLIGTTILVLFAPWQQSVSGKGNVVAYSPTERQQVIETPIKGRIVRWMDGIQENIRVQEGDMIAEIQDLDPSLSLRLQSQLAASERFYQAAEQQLQAARRNLDAAGTIVESYQAQVDAYRQVKDQVIAAANAYVAMAGQKVAAEEQNIEQELAALSQIEADFKRQNTLFQENLVSELKFQETERKYLEAKAKVTRSRAFVESARNELEGKEFDRDAVAQKAQIDIDYAMAMLRKANGDVAKAESDVAKAESDLNKAEKELLQMEVAVSRQQSQIVKAPFDGFLVQIAANKGSQMVKEGDYLCTIVPETEDRAVQLWMEGNDAPLIEPGRHVRFQFEGWPAVQFTGWPSVAVGTFGGTVASVDATDNGRGQFRILVLPDEEDEPWPDGRFLRQGVRANGWVLLNRVPLWYEVWRRMNAFPPVISFEDQPESSKELKTPKFLK